MQLGYQDTMKKFHQLLGSIYTFSLNDEKAIAHLDDQLQKALEQIDDLLDHETLSLIHIYAERKCGMKNQECLERIQAVSYTHLSC